MGYSNLRTAVTGLERAIYPEVTPSEAVMQCMETMVNKYLNQGSLGLPSMTNPWGKVDGDRHRSSALPFVYARWGNVAAGISCCD